MTVKSSNKKEKEVAVGCWRSYNGFTALFTGYLERVFYRIGLRIGQNPWYTIIGSIILCLICSGGLLMWKDNTDNEFLWTPYGSPFSDQRVWIEEHFPKDTRYQTLIISGANVLTASIFRYLLKIDETVNNFTSEKYNNTYQDLCVREMQSGKCATASILRLWDGNPGHIQSNLTDEEILSAAKDILDPNSPGYNQKMGGLLSGLYYDEAKKLIGAKALMTIWLVKQANGTEDSGGAIIDEVAMDWENEFIAKIITTEVPGKPDGIEIFGLAERSYDDGIDGAVASNLQMLFVGFALIFVYIAAVLGRWNAIEQRIFVSMMGIGVIGLALGASFGLCFYMQIFFADMHPIIPFLLLGIGVDDMFVIVQALENLGAEGKKMDVPERIGQTLKHAGVSITVTSVTDMAAFLIGSSTSMPILRAFCLFAAMGVLFLFVFVVTFFIGCIALDEYRQDARKVINFSFFKSKPESWRPNEFSQKNIGRHIFEDYVSKLILTPPFNVIFIILTLGTFGFGVYGVTQIETDYDSIWYMDQNSYQTKFYNSLAQHFPENGERVEVYIGDIEYWKYPDELYQTYEVLHSSQYVVNTSVVFWFPVFHQSHCFDCLPHDSTNCTPICQDENSFKMQLSRFLCNLTFSDFFNDIKFSISPKEICQNVSYTEEFDTNYTIVASRARYQHGKLENTKVKNDAMTEIKDGLANIAFKDEEFQSPIAYAFMYVQWEANIVISTELIRNLSLTFGTITIVTLLMIANIQTCALVLASVAFSVTNVCGFAYFMGLTIEIVTSIILILSVGLALDYAAHMAVCFVCLKDNDRKAMTKESIAQMGPPVFNGGFSTFLAFLLLAWSESYVFSTFFKLFGMVVLFGLYHGLVFVPILLSLIGPVSHRTTNQASTTTTTTINKDCEAQKPNGELQVTDKTRF